MKESRATSNLMEGFPPICKQDLLDVQLYYIHNHLKRTGENIQLENIPETMYGGALLVTKSRKSKRNPLTEAEYLKDASERPTKKTKKAKKDKVAEATVSGLSTIQEEVQDLEPVKVLNKRTRSGKEVGPSPPQLAQPTIPKRNRKPAVKKLKITLEKEEREVPSELVSREVKRRKETDAAVKKALQLAKEIGSSKE